MSRDIMKNDLRDFCVTWNDLLYFVVKLERSEAI